MRLARFSVDICLFYLAYAWPPHQSRVRTRALPLPALGAPPEEARLLAEHVEP